MGILDRIKAKIEWAQAANVVSEEAALVARLDADPNDRQALVRLAELITQPVPEAIADPLTAAQQPATAAGQRRTALWALAEEYAGNPHAWAPLIELARLLVEDDEDAATRRLATACDRDPSGQALAQSIEMLRDRGLAHQAVSLGVAKWVPATHPYETGRQLVLAAVEAQDGLKARELVSRLGDAYPDVDEVARLERLADDVVEPHTGTIPIVRSAPSTASAAEPASIPPRSATGPAGAAHATPSAPTPDLAARPPKKAARGERVVRAQDAGSREPGR
ncbi:MAG: hypothetical protein GX427_05190 [Actinomycetales bacterium]|nr:hypothetical protein [Actinomycetales bacterium]